MCQLAGKCGLDVTRHTVTGDRIGLGNTIANDVAATTIGKIRRQMFEAATVVVGELKLVHAHEVQQRRMNAT